MTVASPICQQATAPILLPETVGPLARHICYAVATFTVPEGAAVHGTDLGKFARHDTAGAAPGAKRLMPDP
jgi:hypothetical protein